MRAVVPALMFGGVITLAELLVVAGLSTPKARPTPPATSGARAIVIAPPPPPPPETEPLLSPLDSSAQVTPEPMAPPKPLVEQAVLPNLPTTLHGLSLKATLPGLTGELSSASLAMSRVDRPDTAAVVRRRSAPRYPAEARRQGIEGFVVLRMRVDEEGRVADAVVVEAQPQGVFERSARRAALAYRFTPAQSRGQPVASTLEQRLSFRLR